MELSLHEQALGAVGRGVWSHLYMSMLLGEFIYFFLLHSDHEGCWPDLIPLFLCWFASAVLYVFTYHLVTRFNWMECLAIGVVVPSDRNMETHTKHHQILEQMLTSSNRTHNEEK